MSDAASKLIRVLHVTFDMGIGGTEQVIRQLIAGSSELGVQNEILCIDGKVGPIGELLQNQGVVITPIKRNPGFDMALIRAMRAHIKTHNVDIVHCHQYTPYLYGFLAAMGTGVKVVFTEHGRFHPDRYRYKAMLINPLIAMLTPAIVAISAATRDALARYEFIPKWKIRVIYNGIQGLESDPAKTASLRESLGIPAQGYIVGTVSRLDPVKNQPMMLRGFKRFLEQCPDAWLLMVGDGPDRSKLEALAKDLQIDRRVIFTGFQTNPVDYLALLNIFLLSSFTEGTSMTLLEAMSLGIPAVTTNVGGNPEIVLNGQTGLLTPSSDEQAFADAVLQLWRNPEQAKVMAEASRERFMQQFSVKTMTQQYYDSYLQVR